MKAAQYNKYGGAEVLEIVDAQKPSLKNGQVLVEVKAASLNPIDFKIRSGMMQQWMPVAFPVTIGGDFAGVVTEIGEGVTEFKVGDELYGQAIVTNGGSGTAAELAAVNAKSSGLKPKTIDFNQAAALPLAGVSAVQAIEEHINLQNNQKILIHGGAGGIGSIAIQLAKMHGAYVATTVGAESFEFVKQLGADEVINYKGQKFEEIVKDFDAVFDTVGGEVINKSFTVLKKDGILVTMAGMPDQNLAKQLGIRVLGQQTSVVTEKLNRLTDLVDGGKIKVQVDKIFPLEQIKEAFDYFEKDHPKGKVVVICRS